MDTPHLADLSSADGPLGGSHISAYHQQLPRVSLDQCLCEHRFVLCNVSAEQGCWLILTCTATLVHEPMSPHLVIVHFVKVATVTLVSVKKYVIAGFFLIKHFLICLLAICLFSLANCLLKSIVCFKVRLFVFLLLRCKNSLQVLDKRASPDKCALCLF
jgi:hypothetical protein